MRIIVADCSAEYSGRLNASLPLAKRVLLIKADNSLLIFSELGSYKPLNWMSAPCSIRDITPDHADDDVDTEVPQKVIRASADKSNDVLEVTLQHIYSDESYDLGEDPGLIKDGVAEVPGRTDRTHRQRREARAPRIPDSHRTGRHHGN